MTQKKKKRGTPARRRKRPAKKKAPTVVTGGLSIQDWKNLFMPPVDKWQDTEMRRRLAIQPREDLTISALGSDYTIGALGGVEVKLTDKEELILSEQVDEKTVLVKPTGQPYLSHPAYTRWFNRAFGRTGWSIVPAAKPLMQGRSVVCPYVLYIHGKPAAFAMGEQEYFEANNRDQTYGDALEATVASALRRCAKRLGVGLELWDKAWLEGWLERNAIKVKVDNEKLPYQWRRRDARPFWNEKGVAADGQHRASTPAPAAAPARAAYNPQDNEPITEPQVKRFWSIVKRVGRSDSEIAIWLEVAYGVKQSRQIKRKDYEAIVTAIEKPGSLPIPREPGAEG